MNIFIIMRNLVRLKISHYNLTKDVYDLDQRLSTCFYLHTSYTVRKFSCTHDEISVFFFACINNIINIFIILKV